jgi:nuclear transport factor 2 (NTF2) superfamily protein
MKQSQTFCIALLVAASVAALAGQTPLGKDAAELRAHLGLQALDRYLETWNSRDAERWATSLNFPHVRPGPGAFELFKTPAQYVASVNFAATLATGWHHSEWTTRKVLQVGVDKVHIAGSWLRYKEDGTPMVGTSVTYIVTSQNERWGVLSRFAAGPTGADAPTVAANSTAALDTVRAYVSAWNSHDPQKLGAALHFPYVRIGDSVEVWTTPAEFLAGPEPGRQRTGYETRLDAADVAQASTNGVNVAVTYSRRDRAGQVFSKYEAVVLVVKRDNGWRVQAVSTMGT